MTKREYEARLRKHKLQKYYNQVLLVGNIVLAVALFIAMFVNWQ